MGYEPMITENERDRRTAAWLIETYGAEAVAEAEIRIAGARKPYPSNIAKILGADLPESLKYTSKETARAHIVKMKETLAKSKTNK
ncbi:cryptic plasmid protein A [Neisseria sp. HMSC070E12]|nr:cryptic plasmid protein A [Neisseria sp. HMSC070E12]